VGHPLARACGLSTTKKETAEVDAFLRSVDDDAIWVIGDLSASGDDDGPLPMVAQVAIQEGRHAAANILRAVKGEPLEPFDYRNMGSMAAVGRGRAVVEIGGRTLTGFPAWPAWALVHVGKLVGFRNRLAVMLNWATDYLFAERAHRLILPFDQVAETEPDEDETPRRAG
jgi:NADH:ubiquinone reductase (H+-translocating)